MASGQLKIGCILFPALSDRIIILNVLTHAVSYVYRFLNLYRLIFYFSNDAK